MSQSQYLIKSAYHAARSSNDPNTQTGAIVWSSESIGHIIVSAHNGCEFPIKSYERPLKYIYFEPPEQKCISRAAKYGIALTGCVMASTWLASTKSANMIVSAGISNLILHRPLMDLTPERWKSEQEIALEILENRKVKIEYYDEMINTHSILFDGKIWRP